MKGQAADIVPEPIKRQGRILFERSADIDAFWASQPQTVIHGDTHLGNLFFEGDSPGFIDWQVATARAWASATSRTSPPDRWNRSCCARSNAAWSSATPRASTPRASRSTSIACGPSYRVGATEFYTSVVAASEAGERAQDPEICRVGVERAVAAIEAHDSLTVLATLADRHRV